MFNIKDIQANKINQKYCKEKIAYSGSMARKRNHDSESLASAIV